uniref:GOLD domain-containing protein n=1 Tax=Peronospora matthiolae TaxID=2874970 RepID=A0AAV1T7U2_9STRA
MATDVPLVAAATSDATTELSAAPDTPAFVSASDENLPHNDIDEFLDVVVTSVDAVCPSVSQSLALFTLSTSDLHVYTVEFVVTRGVTSYCIKRPLPTLYEVLSHIQTTFTTREQSPPTDSIKLPEFPLKSTRNDAAIAQWCTQMTVFLAAHRCGMLQLHPDWLDFVVERGEDQGARLHMTAIDFILQAFPLEKLVVPRSSQQEVVVQVTASGKDEDASQFIVWKFELEEFDVDFSVSFTPELCEQELVEVVHARTRYVVTIGRAVEGSFRCDRAGKITLTWDNSYSRLRGKNVLYQVQVVTGSVMASATAAADALDEAVRVEQARNHERNAALSRALIVSPMSTPDANELSRYSAYIPSAIAQQSWLLSAPINVAGHLASKLFGSQDLTAVIPSSLDPAAQKACQHNRGLDSDARSLVEELNGLNMQLMERMEIHEDSIAKLTAQRDQERSKAHIALVEKDNYANEVRAKEDALASTVGELQRIQREREAWREIQAERDALLEEKHRWAMADDFDGGDNDASSIAREMDTAIRYRLEKELGQAEATILRCRAELGYPLNNHLTGTSTRFETIAREMAASKHRYEEQIQIWEQERMQLTQQLVKARGQRRVLVTEIRNMRTQTESQIAVAMAEASEARMVNKRLKTQNGLLLTQIRTLINETESNEKKTRDAKDELEPQQKQESQQLSRVQSQSKAGEALGLETAVAMVDLTVRSQNEGSKREAATDEVDDSPVPYTLDDNDIAVLNGRPLPSIATSATSASRPQRYKETETLSLSSPGPLIDRRQNPFRARLLAFFEEHDPTKVVEVDEMLLHYKGVEESLFESLELKYSFTELNRCIAQAL